jgi:leucyl-tRNA synthetase
MLSDSPPERDLDWTESGIDGAYRYLHRLWRLVAQFQPALPPIGSAAPGEIAGAARDLRRLTHKTVHQVGEDLDRFHFNKAVARIREFSNFIGEFDAKPEFGWVLREALEALVRLIGPMMPHLAEELWSQLGHTKLLAEAPWPIVDPSLLTEDSVTIAVQLNGKLKGTIELAKDCPQAEAEKAALEVAGIVAGLAGKPPRKVIVVPNRIVNVVA